MPDEINGIWLELVLGAKGGKWLVLDVKIVPRGLVPWLVLVAEREELLTPLLLPQTHQARL
jgi:hypothetical protein